MSTQPSEKQADEGEQQTVAVLLGLVHQLAVELQTQRGRSVTVTLDSSLDRDLRFDSLSRAELVLRIERVFGVSMPENVLATAETPRDLLRAVQRAPSGTWRTLGRLVKADGRSRRFQGSGQSLVR